MNSELGWVHYYLDWLSAWVLGHEDNLGAGFRLSLFGLFTSSEVVKDQRLASAWCVLGAKQATEWGSAEKVRSQ